MDRRFIKSGISGLDQVLGGGFLEGSITTVGGPTGSGKSTLGAQFIYKGATDYGESGIYISIEESRRDFLFHTSGYEWDIASAERERKFVLLDYPVHEVDQVLSQTSALQEIINNTGAKRLVIDSVMPIALFFKDEDERKKGFLKLIENIRRWNITTLIIGEDIKAVKNDELPNSLYGIESFTDGWLNLFYSREGRERERFIEVLKMKGVAHDYKAYPVRIDRSGMSLGATEVRVPAPRPKEREMPEMAESRPSATEAPREPEEKGEEGEPMARISFTMGGPMPKPIAKKTLHLPPKAAAQLPRKETKAPAQKQPAKPKEAPKGKSAKKETKSEIERRIEEAKKRILAKRKSGSKGRKK